MKNCFPSKADFEKVFGYLEQAYVLGWRLEIISNNDNTWTCMFKNVKDGKPIFATAIDQNLLEATQKAYSKIY